MSREEREAEDEQIVARGDDRRDVETYHDDEIETRNVFAIFSSSDKKGEWEVPERLRLRALFGRIELDLRHADLRSDLIEIEALSVFGSIQLIVDDGWEVDADGAGLFGGFTQLISRGGGLRRMLRERFGQRDEEEAPAAERPILCVRGFACFGDVKVIVK